MSERAFVDTNVWVYAVDLAEPAKRSRALEVLAPSGDKDYVVSVQVLGEFYNTVTGKLKTAVPASDAKLFIERMKGLPVIPLDVSIVDAAIAGATAWGISYWDALIVAAAAAAGCSVVITEDLANGVTYGSVRVENPFATEPNSPDGPGMARG
jgi:predicted nucleic acid-binding protein